MKSTVALLAALLIANSLSAAELPEASNYQAVQRVIKATPARIKVVNLWATWCGPCVAEMPDLQKVAERFPRVALIGVSLDDAIPGSRAETRKRVLDFLRDRGVKFPNLLFTGRPGELTDGLKFDGEIPVTFVYRSDGKELTRVAGRINYDAFTKELAALEKQQKR